jgi:polyhydroxybutyrate depolymerase
VHDETVYDSFEFQEVERSYLVHLPANYDTTKQYPIIFVLHGIFSSAEAIAGFSDFNRAADEKGFIVCYPQGYKRSWSIGINVGMAPRHGIDDLAFFDLLLDTLIRDYALDTSKIFLAGMSNGGFMNSNLANNAPDRFAGIALVCSNILSPIENYGTQDKPMKVLLIAGSKDRLVEYEGNKFHFIYRFSGYPNAISYWQERNHFPAFSDSTVIDNVPDDKTSVIRYFHPNPPHNCLVEHYKIVGGGHAWPGREKDFKSNFLGHITREINAADVISDFFLRE